MADYIYLLENRLSPAQRAAIELVREVARAKGFTLFLVGGAVRDLTSGSPVRDLDLAIQGNASKLKKDIEKAGGVIVGEWELGQALFATFPGGVRMEIASTLSVTFPKPGKPVFKPATILEDLRRRDFTANAMALSLNVGSYGLLMDPLNGVADIENRELRLVSNYGFIEDPVRMVRAARLMARLGWNLEEKTLARYETGREEGYISALSEYARGYETEEIFHEEDPLRVIRRLESEGWMKFLAPYWTSAKANVVELEKLRELQTQLQMQGIHPDASAANFPLLTAKLQPAELAKLKASFPRPGFVTEVQALETQAREFGAQLTAKTAATPSQAWKLIMAAPPEVVLWLAYSTRSTALQARFKSFLTEWPQARQKIPYTLMQEMRIVPELPGYNDLVESLFFELMDGKLTTPEEIKAFLEPHSPPAPPPPVNLRRLRAAAKKEAKSAKGRSRKAAAELLDEDGEAVDSDEEPSEDSSDDTPDELPDLGEVAEVLDGLDDEDVAEVEDSEDSGAAEESEDPGDDDLPEPTPPAKTAGKAPGKSAPAPSAKTSAPTRQPPIKSAPVKSVPAPEESLPDTKSKPATKASAPEKSPAVKSAPAPAAKSAPAKAVAVKSAPVKAAPVKAVKSAAPAAPARSTPPAKKDATRSSAAAVSKTNPGSRNPAPPAKAAKKVAAKKVVAPAKKAVAAPPKKAAKKSPAKAPAKPVKKSAPPAKSAPKKAAVTSKKAAPPARRKR